MHLWPAKEAGAGGDRIGWGRFRPTRGTETATGRARAPTFRRRGAPWTIAVTRARADVRPSHIGAPAEQTAVPGRAEARGRVEKDGTAAT